MSPQDRAKAAYAAAEAAEHPADKSALRAAARAWERIAGGGTPWSLDPARRELAALKREVAAATGPCQPPKPKAAPLFQVGKALNPFAQHEEELRRARATIEF